MKKTLISILILGFAAGCGNSLSSQESHWTPPTKEEKLASLQKWQDSLEHNFTLRHVRTKKITKEIQLARFQNDHKKIEKLAHQLIDIGNGDFSEELWLVSQTLPAGEAKNALEKAIATFAHGNTFAAKIFLQFLQKPTLAGLSNLRISNLPAPWILNEELSQALSPTASSEAATALQNTIHPLAAKMSALGNLKIQTDPRKMAKALEMRREAYKHMREALAKSVRELAQKHPEALEMATPLLSPPRADSDSQGQHFTLYNVTVREGDIVAWRFYPAAYSWEAFSESAARFSHIGIVSFSPSGEPLVYDQDVASVNPIPLADALHRGSFVSIFRDTSLDAAGREKIQSIVQSVPALTFRPFDFQFSLETSERQYCSEFASWVHTQAGRPFLAHTAKPRSAKTARFFETLGITSSELLAPGAFLLDERFTHVGTFYQDGASELWAAQAMIEAMLNAFEKASHVDFSKSEGGKAPALSMQFARLLNIAGMHSMTPLFAKNFRAMDRSVMLGQKLIEADLASQKIELESGETYKAAAKMAAQKAVERIYKDAFVSNKK